MNGRALIQLGRVVDECHALIIDARSVTIRYGIKRKSGFFFSIKLNFKSKNERL
jgi:hypothetical protein